MTAITESSAVCARAVPDVPHIITVKSMRKYFMMIDFKTLWQMNWNVNAFWLYTIKINPPGMQKGRIVQAVILIMIVAVAASCAASKEYTSKIFPSRTPEMKDSQAVALRFLELDGLEASQDGWVSTDIIKGKDTTSQTLLLDKLSMTIPPVPDSTLLRPKEKTKPLPTEPVAKNGNPGEVRSKKTRD